jgi:glycosyltransferase involved in cell wall biosynthesis
MIYYASPQKLTWKSILEIVRSIGPDSIYLNSMFSRYFTLYLLGMKKFGFINAEVVLAPRGMLKRSALGHKHLKKKIFLKMLRLFGFLDGIRFHVTDSQEEQDVRREFGYIPMLVREANLPGTQEPLVLPTNKLKGELRVLFVGRLHPIKKLDYLLIVLKDSVHKITLTVIGPIEDDYYWQKCQEIIDKLPVNIQVRHFENVPHHEIRAVILNNHIFALPTAGENFGHAIFEALASGRPVLISDQTPWKNLEVNKAGWDLPLSDRKKFKAVISKVAEMEADQLNEWCLGAWQYCKNYLEDSNFKKGYLKLFS